MAYEHILLDVSPEGTAVLTLNRPAKRNAFNAEVIAELNDAFETLAKNPSCRLVLVRGNGPVFSAGADLEWMKSAAHYSEKENEEDAIGMAEMLRRLFELPQVTIALLHGAAMAGACGIAAACDIAIARKGTNNSSKKRVLLRGSCAIVGSTKLPLPPPSGITFSSRSASSSASCSSFSRFSLASFSSRSLFERSCSSLARLSSSPRFSSAAFSLCPFSCRA